MSHKFAHINKVHHCIKFKLFSSKISKIYGKCTDSWKSFNIFLQLMFIKVSEWIASLFFYFFVCHETLRILLFFCLTKVGKGEIESPPGGERRGVIYWVFVQVICKVAGARRSSLTGTAAGWHRMGSLYASPVGMFDILHRHPRTLYRKNGRISR